MSAAWEIIESDCVEAMAAMEAESVDAVVCDPPYEIAFMGRSWDQRGVAFDPGTWREALRVLKPGGHLLAFGGTRTFHRLTCAVEDAGFEIRDCLMWLYGTGFPKSLDVSKAIDKAAGAEREAVGYYTMPTDSDAGNAGKVLRSVGSENGLNAPTAGREGTVITAPATLEAKRWSGWGTALKPAWEPIIVARKPLIGTVAANVLAYGTGALNIDASRIGVGAGGGRDGEPSAARRYTTEGSTNFAATPGPRGGDAAGRWPANVVLDPDAAEILDEQTGTLTSGSGPLKRNVDKFCNVYGAFAGGDEPADALYGDSGGASRFFYCAKPSRKERDAGVERNSHPTVKPIALMRWLVKLITPPDGLVLDPFVGSGTTGIAAVLEGFRFIGIDNDASYVQIADARIASALLRSVLDAAA